MNLSTSTDNPASDLAASPALQSLPVQFNGVARDYFRVWIVNVILTLITLGIWSAWAKVRTRRWFLGHTVINGHSLDYHATGGQILKGRLIALAVIIGYAVLSLLSPVVELLLFITLLLVMPWAINAGLRFNAYMTSWGNVRFGFRGSYGGAAVFVLMPIAVILSAGLLAPVASRMLARYLANGYRYGNAAFAAAPRLSAIYAALGRSILLFIATLLLCLLVSVLAGIITIDSISLSGLVDGNGLLDRARIMRLVFPIMLNLYAALLVASLYYNACVRNEVLNHMTITGGHRLQSRLSPLGYTWIVVGGLLATVCTLTLAYPWAYVRHYRYLAHSITLLAAPRLDEQVSRQPDAPGSFGGELSELEGFASAAAL